MSRIFDCPCMDNRQSFYGKAKIIEKDNGDKILQSYNTEVCKITKYGKFIKLWDGSSATTMRHVNSFLQFYGVSGGGLAWWREQEMVG